MITSKQKKFIKKNIKKLSLSEISLKIGLSSKEIENYLKNIWRKEKYNKYIRNKSLPNSLQAIPTFSFSDKEVIKNWLKNNWYIILGFIFLVFIIYANGLGGAFVSDDINWIPNNPNINNLGNYIQIRDRPAIWIIFYLAHAIGGLNPFFYRLPNLIFHAGNVIAIFILLKILINKRTAIFTSLIFAVHPILTESVTWIAGGSYAAYTFFFLLSFIFYLLSKNNVKLFIFTIIFFLISLSFSEKAIVLFLIFPLYEIASGTFLKRWKSIIPFFIVGIVVVLATLAKIQDKIAGLKLYNYVEPGFDNPFIKIPISVTEYLKLMFWPSGLSLYPNIPTFTWENYLIRLGIFIFILIIIIISFIRLKRDRFSKHIFFWLLFFIITLLPVLTPYRIASIVAERYVYIGSIGIFTIIGIMFDKLSENIKIKNSIYIIFSILVFALSVRTIVRNHDWISEDNLWIASYKVSPNNPNVLLNMADMYSRHQDYPKAIEFLNKTINLKPDYADAYHNLANTQIELYKKDNNQDYLKQALDNYQLAIKYNPTLWQSYQGLGIIYFNFKEFEKAAEYINDAIKINPLNLNLQYNLGIIYLNSGQTEKAREIFLNILKIDPKNQAVLDILKQIK
jgi:hypothetical protein